MALQKKEAKIELTKLQAKLQDKVTSVAKEVAAGVATADLGTRTIEGVRAQGTRTTQTIAAGAIGNALPLEIVSERWFSPELQMAVLVTRHDPQNGDTVYRLTNIQRGEQSEALFTVPPGYDVKDGVQHFLLKDTSRNEIKKLQVAPRK